ncbi:MAG: antitoxin [Acidobacteriota bacterium]
MSLRVQVVMNEVEREAFRRQAGLEGMSLSGWLRKAAHDRLEKVRPPKIDSLEALRAFFAECGDRERGVEPDWQEHLASIAQSRSTGVPQS